MKKIVSLIMALGMVAAFASCTPSEEGGTSSVASRPSAPSSRPADISSSDVSSVPAEPEKTDLAVLGEAFCDENANHVDGHEYAAACVNDGDITTAWQKTGSINAGDGGTWVKDECYSEDAEIYVGIEWTDEQTIDTIVLKADPGNIADTYENGGYTVEYLDGEEWVEVTNITDIRSSQPDLGIATITFDQINTTAVRVNMLKGVAGGKNAPKIYEMNIYGPEQEEGTDTSDTTESVETSETVSE